jgi:hypothetical protein
MEQLLKVLMAVGILEQLTLAAAVVVELVLMGLILIQIQSLETVELDCHLQ